MCIFQAAEFEAKQKTKKPATPSPVDTHVRVLSPAVTATSTPPIRSQSPLVISQATNIGLIPEVAAQVSHPVSIVQPTKVVHQNSVSLLQPGNNTGLPYMTTTTSMDGQTGKIVTMNPNIVQRMVAGPNLVQQNQRLVINRTNSPVSMVTTQASWVTVPGKQIVVTPKILPAGSQIAPNQIVASNVPPGFGGSKLIPQTVLAAQQNSPVTSRSSSPSNGMIKTQLTDRDVSRLWANDDIKLKKFVNSTPKVNPVSVAMFFYKVFHDSHLKKWAFFQEQPLLMVYFIFYKSNLIV